MSSPLVSNPLLNTPLAHHEIGNEYCPYCERLDVIFPQLCSCGGLIHRQGDIDEESPDRYLEICDKCGARDGTDTFF